MTQTIKRGQIRNQASYDRGVWDWSILNGCFGEGSKISPTDIDGCIERKGRKLYLETKQPGAPVPAGQFGTLKSCVDVDGNDLIIIWGTDKKIERIEVYTPWETVIYDPADVQKLRWLVADWYARVDGQVQDRTEPTKIARAFWRRKGQAYCDRIMDEWVKLDTQEKLRQSRQVAG